MPSPAGLARPSAVRPWRMIGAAVLWMIAAAGCGLLAAVIGGVIVGFAQAVARQPIDAAWVHGPPAALAFGLLNTLVFQLVLALAAYRRAAGIGHGDRSLGLANVAMRRRGVVIVLVAAIVLYILALSIASMHAAGVRDALKAAAPTMFRPNAGLPGGLLLLRAALLVAVAPVAEEIFFRGWLWTGLRQSWSAPVTGLATGALWLTAHFEGDPTRLLVLVPLAAALGLARERCASVRASLAVHVANNSLAAVLITLPALLGR